MPCANTLGETPIPPPSQAEPPLAPAEILRVQAPLLRLIALAIALAVLQLFGFRIRRDRRRPATAPLQETPSAPTTAPAAPSPAPRERRVWRYLDRGPFLAALKSIADDFGHHGQAGDAAAAPPEPATPSPPIRPPTPPRAHQSPRPAAPSATIIPLYCPAPRPSPRLRSKTRIAAAAFARPIRSAYVITRRAACFRT